MLKSHQVKSSIFKHTKVSDFKSISNTIINLNLSIFSILISSCDNLTTILKIVVPHFARNLVQKVQNFSRVGKDLLLNY